MDLEILYAGKSLFFKWATLIPNILPSILEYDLQKTYMFAVYKYYKYYN